MHKLLLARGYLPQELPPLFSSESLSALVGSHGLPTEFTAKKARWTQPLNHNLARPGGLRRRLTVPNPVNFYRLAREFEAHGALLAAQWNKSPFSRTTPNLSGTGPRAIAPLTSDRAGPRARSRVGARYLLRADISQFYPSIYSHAVVWALHTKPVAKAAIGKSLPGNTLDWELQACQLGQTKGIAIGPDTSLGIAELLLSPVDERLNNDCKVLRGTRFIDDIELTFRTLADADHALARLEAILSEFELQLNATKTRIVELPDHVESPYVTTLRRCIPDADNAHPSEWIDYFNQAFLAARADPQAGVLRYAVAAVQRVKITNKSWDLAQSLLWQCVAIDPGCMRFVVDVLLINMLTGSHAVDAAVGAQAVNALIQASAAVGHGSEVLWSIWAALVLKLPVSLASQAAIANMEDALVATAAFVARDHTLFDPAFDSPLWKSWFVEDCFEQEYWLFVYEALYRGWCPGEVAASNIATSPCPAALKAANVTFMDVGLIGTYVPWKLLHAGGGSGGGY
jgi:hypothetical protein